MFGLFKKKNDKPAKDPIQDSFFSLITSLLIPQLDNKYEHPKELFGLLMTNKVASGYVFGLHDAFIQDGMICSPEQQNNALNLIEDNYKAIFGEQAGFALFSTSIGSQDEQDFLRGRMDGGNDFVDFTSQHLPPFCLRSILRREVSKENTEERDVIHDFECEIEYWPREKRGAALLLIAAKFIGDQEGINKYSHGLTESQLNVIQRTLDKMKDG